MAALLSKGALALFALTAFAPSATATGPVAVSAYSDIEVENERKLGLRGQEQNIKGGSIQDDSVRRLEGSSGGSVDCRGFPNLKPLEVKAQFLLSRMTSEVSVSIYNGCKAERQENKLFSSVFMPHNLQFFGLCVPEEGYYVIKVEEGKDLFSGVFFSTFDAETRRWIPAAEKSIPDPDLESNLFYEVGLKSSCEPIVARYYCAEKGVDPGDDKICKFGIEDKDLVCGKFKNCSAGEECRVSECQGHEPLPAEE